MTRHTQGPWKSTEETYPSIKGDMTISSLETKDCIATLPKAWKNRHANAALIAAAPEMLVALEQFVRYCENGKHPEWSKYLHTAAGARMNAAIQKAYGRETE